MFHMLHRWSIRGQQCGRNHTNECICLVSNMTWVTLYRLTDNIHYILQKKNIFFSITLYRYSSTTKKHIFRSTRNTSNFSLFAYTRDFLNCHRFDKPWHSRAERTEGISVLEYQCQHLSQRNTWYLQPHDSHFHFGLWLISLFWLVRKVGIWVSSPDLVIIKY